MDTLVHHMKEAAEEEKKIAIAANNVDADGVPYNVVIVDGGWSHRSYGHGYSANSGVAVIIGKATKKLLFLGVRNKYCSICACAEASKVTIPEHICFLNWRGSSPAMEADIIVEGFRLSEEMYNLRYKSYVGDGDSSVQKNIIDKVSYGRHVTKIECANHLVKNVTKKLFKVAKGAAVTRVLTNKRIHDIAKTARELISLNAREEVPSVDQLKHDLQNVVSHSFGDHSQCRRAACKLAPKVLCFDLQKSPKSFQATIHLTVNSLCRHAESLINDDTSNLAEAYMHMVAKFTGGKQCFYGRRASFLWRTYGAGLAFQFGGACNWHHTAWKAKTGTSPGTPMKKLLKRRNEKKQSSQRSLDTKKLDARSESPPPKRQKIDDKTTSMRNEHYGAHSAKPDMSPEDLEHAQTYLLSMLQVTEAERNELERATVGQSSCPRWEEERKQRLTASRFKDVASRRKNPGVLTKRLLYSVVPKSEAMEWGLSHESVALAAYEESTGNKVEKCGLFVDLTRGYLAASPDGLVGEDRVLEVKCPFSVKHLTPEQAATSKKSFCSVLDSNGALKLRRSHTYYAQVQGQLMVTQRSVCDFIIWTPEGIAIEEIPRDDGYINDMVAKLERFYLNNMLPELVDPRQYRSMPIREHLLPPPVKTKRRPRSHT